MPPLSTPQEEVSLSQNSELTTILSTISNSLEHGDTLTITGTRG